MKSLAILCVFVCASALAESLIVIYDSGDALPITPYLPTPAKKSLPTHKRDFTLFPVQTKSMTPGHVASRSLALPQMQIPLFVVGYDPRSLDWLKTHRLRLKSLGAVGMVVSVENEVQFKELQNVAVGLDLLPASGEDLAVQLQVFHYPVLISKSGIEQ